MPPPFRVLVAPAPFKDALGAADAAAAIAEGIAFVSPNAEVRISPVADGGEGTLDALVGATPGSSTTRHSARDPLGRATHAEVGVIGDRTAIVELARASGYERLRADERDPEVTSTWGTGDLIRAALDAGARRIIVGVGGSATCDGGMGLAQALGVRFLDAAGRELDGRGGDLGAVRGIDLTGRDPRLATTVIEVACDVQNPFVGPNGAARVFGPQKGATPQAVERLEAGMVSFAAALRREVGAQVATMPMAGAAGGAAGGMVALLGAALIPGAALVLRAIGFEERLRGADLCITGEGSLDQQTLAGKAAAAVAEACGRAGVPCVGLCGHLALTPEQIRQAGFAAAIPINRQLRSLDEALAATGEELRAAAASVIGLAFAARPVT